MANKFVWNAERFGKSRAAMLVRLELAALVDARRMSRTLEALKSGRAFLNIANTELRRVESLLKELPAIIIRQAELRRSSLAHLFAGAARAEPSRTQYFRLTEELLAIMRRADFDKVLRQPGAVRLFEEHAQGLLGKLAGTIDDYTSLGTETSAFNAIVQRLFPKDFPSLRLDAHHIIEARTFEKFRSEWKLLGWNSAEEMPSIALFYEYHIRSPKRLKGLEGIAKNVDATSLTQELFKNIDLDKINTADELISAYEAFYSRQAIWKDVRPALAEVRRELTARRTAAKLVRSLKK
jgi:hypothetical protein